MKKLESSLTNMVLVLTGVAVVMGGILAYVNHLTEGPIRQQKEKALADGIKTVMACSDVTIAQTDTVRQDDAKGKELVYIIYQAKDAQGKDLGAAVESTTGGFGGNLKILVGFDSEGKILGYTLLEHAETPGLGAKADKWFQKGEKGDIIGKDPKEKLTVSKDGGQVDAITASTITSRAFLLAVNNAYSAYKSTPATDGETGATKQVKSEK
jgi:electron transport complex protein RnfG